MQKIKIIGGVILAVVLIGLFLNWTAERDEKVFEAAAKYERCVKEIYHTTPMQWYNEHGEFPECSNDEITAEYR